MTNNRHKAARRGLAVAGAAALGLLALPMVASAAPVDDQPWVSGSPTSGTLTVVKYESGKGPGTTTPAPLGGVTFEITQVGVGDDTSCSAIDLGTSAGWNQWNTFQPLWAVQPEADRDELPSGYCAVDTTSETTAAGTGQAEFTSLALAPYLVVETDTGENLVSTMESPFLVTVPLPSGTQWDYAPIAYPKNVLDTAGVPTKTVGTNVAGTSTLAWMNDATVPWTITALVQKTADLNSVIITDIPNAGLTVDVASVLVGSTTLTEGTDASSGDYYFSANQIIFNASGLAAIVAAATDTTAATVTANMTTTLGATTFGSLDNRATLTINGSVSAPMDTLNVPVTNWGKLQINKHIKDDTTKLAGATFKVWPAGDGTTCETTAPASGTTTLGPSTASATTDQIMWVSNQATASATNKVYCVQETVAPQGYILDSAVKTVNLTPDSAGVTLDFPNTAPTVPTLPLTGGTGTIILTVAGLGVLALAVVVAVRRQQKTA